MKITLRQLEVFAAIASHGHVTRAAETVAVTPEQYAKAKAASLAWALNADESTLGGIVGETDLSAAAGEGGEVSHD